MNFHREVDSGSEVLASLVIDEKETKTVMMLGGR